MRALILGCGYTGQSIAKSLHHKGWEVTATTRKLENIPHLSTISTYPMIWQNTEESSLAKVIEHQDVIFISIGADKSADYAAAYTQTAKTILHLGKHLKKIPKLIYTSSCSVYSESNGGIVTEDSPLDLESHSAKILIEAENTFLSLEKYNWPVCIFRLSEIYGPNREIYQKLQNMEGKPIPGDGSRHTNMIHVDDINSASIFAIDHGLKGIYNLSDDEHILQKTLYAKVCEKHHLTLPTWDPSLPLLHGKSKQVSNQKIKKEGYKFLHPNRLI